MFKALFGWLRGWLKSWFESKPCLDDQATVQQWADMGDSLARSFSLGVGVTTSEATAADDWTTEKWVQLGQSLSHIHPGL